MQNIMKQFDDLVNGISELNNSVSPEKLALYDKLKLSYLTEKEQMEDFKNKLNDISAFWLRENVSPEIKGELDTCKNDYYKSKRSCMDAKEGLQRYKVENDFPVDEDLGF